MEILTEEQLRAIADSEELEQKEISWFFNTYNKKPDFIYKIMFDYDQGFSILDKENTKHCLTGIHGPKYKSKKTNFTSKEQYHKYLSVTISLIKTNKFIVSTFKQKANYNSLFGRASCSFS